MAANYFRFYVWLVDTLYSRGPQTLNELETLWRNSALNDECKPLANRTFSNWRRAIENLFGLEIVCDRRTNRYRIELPEDVCGSRIHRWMIDTLRLNAQVLESKNLNRRIVFEDVPSSSPFLQTVLQAMRENRVLEGVYAGYRMTEARDFVLEPYFLRLFKRRWYLYARKGNDDAPHRFALDRFQSLAVGKASFEFPTQADASAFFSGSSDLRHYPDEMPCWVRLKADRMQANYFRSLPLHPSQQEDGSAEDGSVLFRYFLVPDYDFRQDVLSFGLQVEILEPETLRAEFREQVMKLWKKYE